MADLLQVQKERGLMMTKEWPKELPPFEKMKDIFFRGGFDIDGDWYSDPKSGKRYWIDIKRETAEVKDA